MLGNVNQVHKNLGVKVLKHFQLIVPHQAGVNEVLQIKSGPLPCKGREGKYLKVGKPLLHPEADRPHAHAVGEQAVPHDVPPHQPLTLLLDQGVSSGTRTYTRSRTFPIRKPMV